MNARKPKPQIPAEVRKIIDDFANEELAKRVRDLNTKILVLLLYYLYKEQGWGKHRLRGAAMDFLGGLEKLRKHYEVPDEWVASIAQTKLEEVMELKLDDVLNNENSYFQYDPHRRDHRFDWSEY